MIWLNILILSVATSAATKEAVASQAQRVVARVLLLPEPRIVWCRVEPRGGIWRISREPGGREVPHGATGTVQDGRPGEAPIAYYYPMPTPLLHVAGQLGFHADQVLLLATGREVTTGSRRWREFRRCSEEEFQAAFAAWTRRGGG